MNDKQIIIDGCEFQSDCIEYKDISYLKIMPICAIHELSIACHDKVNKCKYYKLYKQLKAKEQECEELRNKLNSNIERMNEQNEKLHNENKELKAQLEQQKKENEEFKEKLSQAKDITEPLNSELLEDKVIREIFLIVNDCINKKVNPYKHALEEIEHQVTELFLGVENKDRAYCEKILDIINKGKENIND